MKEQLLKILKEVKPGVDFEKETKLIEDGILDSFDIISTVQEINDTFGVSIDVEDLEPANFNTADAMLELIVKLQTEA